LRDKLSCNHQWLEERKKDEKLQTNKAKLEKQQAKRDHLVHLAEEFRPKIEDQLKDEGNYDFVFGGKFVGMEIGCIRYQPGQKYSLQWDPPCETIQTIAESRGLKAQIVTTPRGEYSDDESVQIWIE